MSLTEEQSNLDSDPCEIHSDGEREIPKELSQSASVHQLSGPAQQIRQDGKPQAGVTKRKSFEADPRSKATSSAPEIQKVKSALSNQSSCLNSDKQEISSEIKQISALLQTMTSRDPILLNPYLLGAIAVALLILIHQS